MALYRKGEAELKENGQVIGYGTGWQDQLALIRVGATMVFLSGEKPVLGVVSAIESPEKMTVVDYDGQTAARGKYLILLHDSITVEGLAQDVAETLRYYQSKETEIADALDYFRTFDWKKLEAIQADVKANAETSGVNAANALQSETNAAEHAGNANRDAQIATDKAASASDSQAKAAESEKFSEQYMNNAKELAASASLSASAAKGSEDKVSADAKTASQAAAAALQSEQNSNQNRAAAEAAQAGAQTSEANSKQSELNAYEHRVAADASDKSASGSASTASTGATKATEQADRAQRLADSINPESMLKKENNLSDVADAQAARNSLDLDWLRHIGGVNYISSPDRSKRLAIGDDGLFVWQDSNGNTIPVPIASGGTGSTTADGARNNMGIGATQAVRFANVEASVNGQTNGGILESKRLNADASQLVSESRFYNEVQAGVVKTTIHTFNVGSNKNNYTQIDENGNLSGVRDVSTSGVVTAGAGIDSLSWISARQTKRVGCTTQSGGSKDIFLQNVEGDGGQGGWVNLLQGNWYNGYWQLGGVRGNGADLQCVRLGMNDQGVAWKSFDFYNSFGGHLVAPRGFRGSLYGGGWAGANDYMGCVFDSGVATNNDGGYAAIVGGTSQASSGYKMNVSLGLISGGTGDWPRAVIKMLGDNTYHRGFEFHAPGSDIITWGQQGGWDQGFAFQKAPTSDRDLKKDIEYTNGKESYDRVMQWLPTMFKYKGSDIQRFGLIAQDLNKIDSQYVKIVPGGPVFEDVVGVNEDGEEYVDHQIETDVRDDTLALDSNVMMADMACAMVYMGNKMDEMQKRLEAIEAMLAK